MFDASLCPFDFEYEMDDFQVAEREFVVTRPNLGDPLGDETVRKVLKLLQEQYSVEAAFVAELHDATPMDRSSRMPSAGVHDENLGDPYVMVVCRQIFGQQPACFIRVPVVLANGGLHGVLYAPSSALTEEERQREAALIDMTAKLAARLVDTRGASSRAPAANDRQELQRLYA